MKVHTIFLFCPTVPLHSKCCLACFIFVCRCLQKCPLAFLKCEVAVPAVQCAVAASTLEHRDANLSVMKYLKSIISCVKEKEKLVWLKSFSSRFLILFRVVCSFYYFRFLDYRIGRKCLLTDLFFVFLVADWFSTNTFLSAEDSGYSRAKHSHR